MRRSLLGWITCMGLLVGPMYTSSVAAVASQGEQTVAARVRQVPKLAGEKTTILGSAKPGRTVELQRLREGRWASVSQRTAGRNGNVAFKVRVLRATARYRLVARPVDPARRSVKVLSQTIRVAPAQPTSRLELENAPIGQDNTGQAATPGLASFWPARPGAPVVIQRRKDGAWVNVASGEQGPEGRFSFLLTGGVATGKVFRAVSRPPRALRAIVSPAVTGDTWHVSFADEFSGPSLSQVWAERPSLGARRACVTTSDAYRLANGTLQLFAVRDATAASADETCPYGRYRNGHVGTQNSASFRYGYAAARIKFSPERGQHGAFWLQPKPEAPALAPEHNGSEIDIAEYFGDTGAGGLLSHVVHYRTLQSDGAVAPAKVHVEPNVRAMLGPELQMSDDYHVLSVEWTPAEYVFRVDGAVTFRTSRGVSHQPQYLILSMLTSDTELPRLTGNLPSPMSVDWVRVWQR